MPLDESSPEPKPSRLRRLFRALGPGIVAGAADDDPSGIVTYSIAGAQHGTGLLWTALVTWPLMAVVQMTCARIGMVTGRGLAGALRRSIPRPLLIGVALALFAANTINIGADLAGMADAASGLLGVGSHVLVIVFGIGIAVAMVQLRYQQLASGLKWLAFVLLAYVVVAFLTGPDWSEVARATLVPSMPRGREQWATLVAILGTTISPYLFFWQASQEVEEEKSKGRATLGLRLGATREEIVDRRIDVAVGTFFSNAVMFFIILATAMTLHRHGITQITTAGDAARALEPLAGRLASVLYAVGIIGVGLLAIPTLAGSAAYALAETFAWRQGLDRKLTRARRFYSIVLLSTAMGVALDFAHVNPIRALYWTAILNGLLAPFLLLAMLVAASSTTRMRGQPSPWYARVILALTAALMIFAGVAMFVA